MHPASEQLPLRWNRTDQWYNFTGNVRGVSHVLATVDETTYTGGTMGFDHPIAWCKDYQGGRSFYTALGDTPASFVGSDLRAHLGGAIQWAAGVTDGDCGATVLANYQMDFVAAPPNVNEPIGFDVLPDGRVIQTDRRGGVRLHDTATNTTHLLAQIPVYMASEDGLYGPAVDNDFATNKWVYLYYSPLTQEAPFPTTTPTANAPNTGRRPERVGSVAGLLPAEPVQVRRRCDADARPGQRAEDPEGAGQPGRLLPRGRRHRLRLGQQPVDGHRRRHPGRRRQLGRLLAPQRHAHHHRALQRAARGRPPLRR